jgi:hypothetical protein
MATAFALPRYVIWTFYFSLAAAVFVFAAMLVLTVLHP